MQRSRQAIALTLFLVLTAPPALAAVPPAETLLADIGYSANDIASIKAGKIVTGKATGANERDLAAAFAFLVKVSPAELIKDLKAGLLSDNEPDTIAGGSFNGAGSVDDLAKLVLNPDPAKRVKQYVGARGGSDLNLSTAEIAAFNKLGSSAAVPAVEAQVHSALMERLTAYQKSGLDGIAAYDRGKGTSRAVGDELKTYLSAMKALQKYAPAAYTAMTQYPNAKPAGTAENFRWMHFSAHDVPTVALVHGMAVPDGDAFIMLQRQFYVSEGYNCTQAVAGFLPVQGGTIVLYANHTSTDQVAGFGGSVKRSIGSSMMSSQLKDLFTKIQTQAK